MSDQRDEQAVGGANTRKLPWAVCFNGSVTFVVDADGRTVPWKLVESALNMSVNNKGVAQCAARPADVCSNCDGTGKYFYIAGKEDACAMCDGTGKFQITRPAEDGLAERLEIFATAIQITDGPTDEYELVSKAASALRWQARLGDCPEDWRTGAFDIYKELPDDEHAPWYVKCPSGQLIKLGGHASDHEDKKQAYFIAMACNAALGRQA